MADRGYVGTLEFLFQEAEGEGEGEAEIELASIVDFALSMETAMLDALDPDEYGWDYTIPGTQSWGGNGSAIQLVDGSTLERKAYVQRIEQAWLNKTLLNLRFRSPTGAQYLGEGYVAGFSLGESFDSGYRGQFSIKGRGPLTQVENGTPDWCPSKLHTFDYWGTVIPLYLGTEPGWVKIRIGGGSTMSELSISIGGVEQLLMSNAPYLANNTEGWFYYNPGSGPFVIDFAYVPYGIPLAPEYRAYVWCPGQGGDPPEGEGEGEGEGE